MTGAETSRRDRGPLNRGFIYRERLGSVAPGTTVLAYLSRRYPHSPETVWRERIHAGEVLLDGAPVIPEMPLPYGGELAWHRPPWREPPAPMEFGILHADLQVLAVNKPAGLPTLPGGGFLDHTLLALVRRGHPEATPVHRLGRWTSGVVLFARTPEARAHLARAFRLGSADKRYRALASGRPEQSRWEITVPIGPVPHRLLGTVHAANPRGAPARTTVSVLELRGDSFLAEVAIATGKPHQIRIHLAAAGHPLVGDPLYPSGGVPPMGIEALPGDPGYHLHAAAIRVTHPATGQEFEAIAPIPPLLQTQAEREDDPNRPGLAD